MDIISAVLPPLVGGVIGYITNDLAIRMLFRPFKPVVLGRFRLPLTPGIVPRHQAELAVALGARSSAGFSMRMIWKSCSNRMNSPVRWPTA
jgi:hypothetical protein